ncbi:MAG TPA: sigma-E factor negative regulatory protein [Aquabacterium sp.]|nr:sigma-E factor negative regulatory protein [Aquabacterium sp.]
MTEQFSDSQAAREALSALADGEATTSDIGRACAAWKDDVRAKQAWQTYHLIGDVMRSDDLAKGAGSADFLNKFRERLAQEPVVLAPSRSQATPEVVVTPAALKRRAWSGPFAVAAGFMLVVGAVVSTQMSGLGGKAIDSAQVAQSNVSPNRNVAWQANSPDIGSVALASSGNAPVLSGMPVQQASNVSVEGASFSRPDASAPVLIRDPQVDQLLASLPRHPNGQEASFASQGGMARTAAFELP